jgi:hypothetical protein
MPPALRLSLCSGRTTPASAAPLATPLSRPLHARPRCHTRAAGAAGPTSNNQGGDDDDQRRAAVSTRTATPADGADADDADSAKTVSPILVFDAAVPSSGLAPAQVERLAAQLLQLLEKGGEAGDGSSSDLQPLRRRFLLAEGRPAGAGGGDATPSSSPALAQLASALGATLALSEPPDPRRAFDLAATISGPSGVAAAEAAVEAALAEGRRDPPLPEEAPQDDVSSSTAATAARSITFPPSRRLDLPDLALRPRPLEAPGSLRRRNASWQRALELAYFLLQLSAAGIGFRLHRVGDDSDSDDDDDSDDDIAALMADDSDDDDDDDSDDEDEDDDDDNNDPSSTGVERSSDASIRLGGPGVWEIFSGKNQQDAAAASGSDDEDEEDDSDAKDDDDDNSSKRRRKEKPSLDKSRHTLSITFARPDALRGDLGRKLFGGRTRGTPTPASASLDDDGGGGNTEEKDDDAAAADAEAAERARLYRIAEGFDTDDGDLPPIEEPQQEAPLPPPLPPPVLPTTTTASALDAIAALEATTTGAEDGDEDDDEDGPFEVVSVRPESPPIGEIDDNDSKGDGDDDEADAEKDDDEALTDEQMGAVAAEVLADAREGELRGARTLRLTGVGLGDMVLLASGLLAVSQVSP